MSVFPKPYSVLVSTRLDGETDAHGNPVASWSDPVEVPVYCWAPGGAAQEDNINREQVSWDLDLYTDEIEVGPADRVTVKGLDYEVVGYPEDYRWGPFGWQPGVRVNLRRVEG